MVHLDSIEVYDHCRTRRFIDHIDKQSHHSFIYQACRQISFYKKHYFILW